MELPNVVGSGETLYRVVKRSMPACITEERMATPALFKDREGVSVDRDGGRDEEDIKLFIKEVTFKERTKAIGKVLSGFCFSIGAKVQPDPLEDNPFHANIILDDDEKISNLQALQLADHCVIIEYYEDVKWTGSKIG